MRIDVFNGDADGICALTQLHLAEPRDALARLVTGVKRDIELLEQVEAGPGDEVTVLDISLDKNRAALRRLLAAGASVLYVDHHYAGEIPQSERLRAVINEAPDVCTSLLVNGRLTNRFCAWAVVGAFGDNLKRSAELLATSLNLSTKELEQLKTLGTCLNYNGYGESIEDLHFAPAELFKLVSCYSNPLTFIAEGCAHFQKLEQGYQADMAAAAGLRAEAASPVTALFVLPNAAWARRVCGVYSNDLSNLHPDRAHAVLTEKSNGNYLVSVRAPLIRKTGADALCRQFASGGGRAAAAGINELPAADLQRFVAAFERQFQIS